MRKSFAIIIIVFVGIVILINSLLEEPTFDKLSDKADFELQTNQPELAEKTLLQITLEDSLNVGKHYRYITTHFDIPESKKIGKNKYEYRDDKTIQDFYNSLVQSADSNLSDIGFYGKGFIQVNFKNYSAAISEFLQVKNKNLAYLNNSIGHAYKQLDSISLAEQYFRKEIESNGNLNSAYYNLIQLLFKQHRTDELEAYLENPEIKQYFPPEVERAIYFKSFQPIQYGFVLFKRIFSSFNIWGSIAALLIMGSWMMYLRRLDIFEPEKWRYIILTVFLGMLFSFLTFPLADFDNLIFGFRLNGGLVNDFFYSVIGIGMIEEFVKIIPLLLMMKFTKEINEPFDYIVYASLSALGFAFVENLAYFDESRLHIIHGRALTAVVSHMFNSSIIAYGILLNKYKWGKNPYLNFIFFFVLASIAHGFYDFWLLNKSASIFSIFTIIFLLVSMNMWNSFKNNALNQSNFYDKDISLDTQKLQDYLLYSLTGILLFEYIAIAFKFSPAAANAGLLSSLYSGAYLIIFMSESLSKFSIMEGEWAPIKYWVPAQKIDYDKIVGADLILNSAGKNGDADEYFPNSGKILKRLTVSEEPDWYLIKLDKPKQFDSYLFLIRTRRKDEAIEKGIKKYIVFYLIPMGTDLDRDDLKRSDFKFYGWATAE